MFKFLKIIFFSLLVVTVSTSCDTRETYADRLKDERRGIANFIADHNIEVVRSKPEGTGEWKNETGQDIYHLSKSGLYYHQIELGNETTSRVPMIGDKVFVRYIGKTLPGTVIYDNSPIYQSDPASFNLSSGANGKQFGSGFQEAVRNLRVGGSCRIIVPFNLGNGTNYTLAGGVFSDAANYVPMVYEIWLVNIE